MIGDAYKLKMSMLGCHAGSVGYVIEEYDFGSGDRDHVQLILPNGEWSGFSPHEIQIMLEFIEHVEEYENYEFTNVMNLHRDYTQGYWKWKRWTNR